MSSFGATHPLESEGAQGGLSGSFYTGYGHRQPFTFPVGLSWHVDANLNFDIEGQSVSYEEWVSVRFWWSHYAHA